MRSTSSPAEPQSFRRPGPLQPDRSHGRQDPSANHTRGRRRASIELAAILVLLAVASALGLVDASTPRFLPVVQAAGMTVVPLATGVAALALLTRRWRIGAAAAALSVVQLAGFAGWWVAGEHAVPPGPDSVVVMAANLQYGGADTDELIAHVRRHQVDVLVLTEFTTDAEERLAAAGIDDLLPHALAHPRDDAGGTAILSRHALSRSSLSAPPQLFFETALASVRTPSGPIDVLSVHPVPPWPGHTDMWHAELTALTTWAAEQRQAAQQDQAAGQDEAPLIVAGDMNATAAHPVFRRFHAAGLYDAHREVGGGPVATWPQSGRGGAPLLPLLHLDHVLVRGLGVSAAGTTALSGTDHTAVWARLEPTAPR